MSAIFISHSSHDAELARSIERLLARHDHHSVFLDFDPEKGIVGGQSWERTLYRKLRACRAVIALITDRYLASHWCFAELALARMEGKHVLALQADPLAPQAALPAILLQEQLIDLRGDAAEGERRLKRALAALDLPAAAGDWDPSLPPYPGLQAYREADAPVFFGREAESAAGVELLERGAPNLVLVLGASGSGKSSLALAGVLPRLRSRESRWLIADPFRPGRDPLGELVESLARLQSRLATEGRSSVQDPATLREQLRRAFESVPPTPGRATAAGGTDRTDERLRRLVELLDQLQADPPWQFAMLAREHLTWTLDDLRRLLDAAPPAPSSTARAEAGPPLAAVARDIVRRAPRREARLLVVVDQFEELLGLDADAPAGQAAQRFLHLLREALDAEHGAMTVLATMRSDFLGLFQRDSAMQGVDFASLSLGPMGIDGMRRVIEAPARLAAIEIEPGLVERLLEDTETADALPLLSFTLSVLCRDRSDRGRITLADYQRAGGLQGTIGREADAVLAAATRQRQQDVLRGALLRMARLGESGAYARVAVAWTHPDIAPARTWLDALVERRVLVSRTEGDTPVVEVAHEALFRTWAPLRAWLEDARAELILREQIERDAAAWHAGGRRSDALWWGGRLAQAQDWLRRSGDARAAGLAGEFLRAGLRRRLRRRALMVGMTLGVIAMLAGFLLHSLMQTELARAERARALDMARVSIAGEWLGPDPTRAALVLLELGDPEHTRFGPRRLGQALAAPLVEAEFRHAGPVHSVAIDGLGRRMLTTHGREALVWDARNGRRLRSITFDEPVTLARFDPTGRVVLVRSGVVAAPGEGFFKDQIGARAWVHDAESGQRLFTIEHDAPIDLLRFSRDGHWLLTGAGKGPARLWDLRDGRARPLPPPAPDQKLTDAVFSHDGTLLIMLAGRWSQRWHLPEATAVGSAIDHQQQLETAAFSRDDKRLAFGGRAGVQALGSADTMPPAPAAAVGNSGVRQLSFSPDGVWLLAVGPGGKVSVLSAQDGSPRRFSEAIEHPGLRTAFFSDDGERIVTLPGHDHRRAYGTPEHDNQLRLWDAASGEPRGNVMLASLPDELMDVAFDAGARRLVASVARRIGGGRGQTFEQQPIARLWSVDPTDRRIVRSLEHADEVDALGFAPDGRHYLTASGNVVRVWERGREAPLHQLQHAKRVNSASFSADGRAVLSASDDGTARIWETSSGRERFVVRHEQAVEAVAALGEGKLLATVSGGALRLWAAGEGQAGRGDELAERPNYSARLNSKLDTAMISPDGRRVAILASDAVRVWDLTRPPAAAPRYLLPHGGWARQAVFIDGGAALVTGGDEARAHVWDLSTGGERFALDPGATLAALAVSPDGSTVLTYAEDGRVRLWSSRTGKLLHEGMHPCRARDAWFVADGKRAVTSSEPEGDGCQPSVITWDVATGQLISSVPNAGQTVFSADGRLLLGPGAGSFNTFQGMRPSGNQVWDVDTAEMRFVASLSLPERLQAAAFSADGTLLLTAGGRQATLWAVGGRELQALLDAATTVCLDVGFRHQNLGESDEEARRRQAACHRRHGREGP